MTPSQQLKEIKGILNLAMAPTIRIEKKRKGKTEWDVEYPMSEAERVQWLVDEMNKSSHIRFCLEKENEAIAEEAAGEDL